jgi:raffinose/stachyose/melibiose transport system permease protein
MDKVFSDKKAICFFVLPALIFFLLIVFIPIFMSVYYSFLDWDGIGVGKFVGLKNYIYLFTNKNSIFWKAAKNSFLYALVSLFIQLPISLIIALILAWGVKHENFYRSIYFIPVIISSVVIGQLWMKIYNTDYGLLNALLRAVGLENKCHMWLGDKKYVLGATFVPMLWQYVGYHMLLMYGAIKGISPEIFEAAKIDGSGPVRTSFRITIPLIKPMIRVCMIFSLIGSLKIFDLVFILTNGGPAGASEVPATLMYKTIFLRNKYGQGSAIAVFIVVECLLFTLAIQKLFSMRNSDEN